MEDVIILGIVGLVVALVVTVFSLLWYSGLFTSVDVGTGKPPFGKLRVAYKFVTGPYKECGPIFNELHRLAPDLQMCGIYYDDPKTVDSSKLRYMVSAVLAIGDGEVNKITEKKLLDNGYKSFEIPAVDYAVQATFPYVWDLSLYIAIMKVYPRLNEYIEERQLSAHPAIEFYDSSTIHFVMPLSKQETFYVPEVAEQESGTKSGDETEKESQGNDKSTDTTSPMKDEKKNDSAEDSSSSFEQVDVSN